MTLREAFGIVALVVVLQLCLGALIYLFTPAPLELPSILIAIAVMAAVAGSVAAVLTFAFRRYARERAVRVAMLALSEDERRVLRLVMDAGGEVRQDHLRKQLDFSKAKLSALVNNLERKRAITKTRYHKTNILRLTEEFKR